MNVVVHVHVSIYILRRVRRGTRGSCFFALLLLLICTAADVVQISSSSLYLFFFPALVLVVYSVAFQRLETVTT